jgi:putative ATP-dependent DNA ligase
MGVHKDGEPPRNAAMASAAIFKTASKESPWAQSMRGKEPSGFSVDKERLQEIVAAAHEKGQLCEEHLGNWHYRRVMRSFRSLPSGTALLGDTLVFGYPKIGRLSRLDTGLRAQFSHAFWVEEKVDGYNVRIFQQGGEVLAITRRGYVCPFTTDRLGDFIDARFFAAHPELVLCAEVAGPENPYNRDSPPYINEDIALFAFDLMRKNRPGFLPHDEKERLLREYGVPEVCQYGRFELAELPRLAQLACELDRTGREGIVHKEDSAEDRRAKYVTGRINLADLRVGSAAIKQLPAEYFTQRILRLGLFLEEHHIERTPDLHRELGEVLIEGVMEAVSRWRQEGKVADHFRCRFHRKENAELMLEALYRLLGKGHIQRQALERKGEYYVLEFSKTLPKTTGLLAHLLQGGLVFD